LGEAWATVTASEVVAGGFAMTGDDSSINGMAALERSRDVTFMV
jgi:hypothetical protein